MLWLLKPRPFLMAVFVVALPLAAMVRPTYELLVVVLTVCLFAGFTLGWLPHLSQRQAALPIALGAVFSFGTQAAWSGINYFRFGYFGTSRMLPIALSTKTADLLEFLPQDYADLRDILIPYRDQNLIQPFRDHTGKDYIYRAMPAVTKHYGGDMTAVTIHVKAALLYLIKHKPMSYLSNCLRSLGLYWMPNDCRLCGMGPATRALTALLQITVEIIFFVQALALAGLGLIYVSARFAGRPPRLVVQDASRRAVAYAYAVGVAIVLYTALLSCCLGTGEPRYRQTVDLLILCLCAMGHRLWRSVLAGTIPPIGSSSPAADQV
jgi:hypothetical protein